MTDRPGFFIPYRHAAATRPRDYPAIAPLIEARARRFLAFLSSLDELAPAFARFGGAPPAPRFEQDWFPRLDACAAYAVVLREAPALLIEIGCGHSTRIMARAIADGGLNTRQICIDPAPRAALDGLAVEQRRTTLDGFLAEDRTLLAEAGLLFIDSSHIAMPGSDVDRLVNDALPRLRSGAIVHFHDIFLPWAYPRSWAWRGYNEQLLVAALLSGGGYEPLFSSAYVVKEMADALGRSFVAKLPLLEGAIESSLWLRKK